MRVPIEASLPMCSPSQMRSVHHPLKMRVPIEAALLDVYRVGGNIHHPLKMRVPIEARSSAIIVAMLRGSITL